MTVSSAPNAIHGPRLAGPWQKLGIGFWAVFFILCLSAFFMSVYVIDLFFRTPYDDPILMELYPERDLAEAEEVGKPFQEAIYDLGLTPALYAHYFTFLRIFAGTPYVVLSILIMLRRSDRLMAVLFAIAMILLGSAGTLYNPIWYWIPESYPWHPLLSKFLTGMSYYGMVVLYTFPDGRVVPRWTRWIVLLIFPYGFALNFIPNDSPFSPWNWPGPFSLLPQLVFLGGGLYAITYRYRRYANAVQKQQIKWFTTGAVLIILSWLMDYAVWKIYPSLTGEFLIQAGRPAVLWELFQDTTWYISTFLCAICITISVFRYGLWEIDLIIRRTLQYTLLTGVLSGVYFGGVAVLQSLLSAVGGQQSLSVVIVITTLAIAALFNPLRRRLQDFIDRRFYRQKYDAEHALSDFAAAARSETDLEQLSQHLAETVQDTLQPDGVELWLRAVERRT